MPVFKLAEVALENEITLTANLQVADGSIFYQLERGMPPSTWPVTESQAATITQMAQTPPES